MHGDMQDMQRRAAQPAARVRGPGAPLMRAALTRPTVAGIVKRRRSEMATIATPG